MTDKPNAIVHIHGHTVRINDRDGRPVFRVSNYRVGPLGPGWYERSGAELIRVGTETDAIKRAATVAASFAASAILTA